MFDTRSITRRRAITDTLVVTDFCARLRGLWRHSGPIRPLFWASHLSSRLFVHPERIPHQDAAISLDRPLVAILVFMGLLVLLVSIAYMVLQVIL